MERLRTQIRKLLCFGIAASMLLFSAMPSFAEEGGDTVSSGPASSSVPAVPASSNTVSNQSSTASSAASSGTPESAPAAKAAQRDFQVFVNDREITDGETVFEMQKTGLLNFTVVSEKPLLFNAGTGSVAGTGVSVPYNPETKKTVFTIVATGDAGTGSGIYINGTRIFIIKISGNPYTSSNYNRVTLPQGERYTFTVTSKQPEDKITFNVGNGALISTSADAVQTVDGQKVYTFHLTGRAAGTTGVYVRVNDVSYRTFDCEVTAPKPPEPDRSSFTCSNTFQIYRTVGHSFEFQVTSGSTNTVGFHLGTGSIGRTSLVQVSETGEKRVYTFRIDAQSPGGTGVYVTINGKSFHVFSMAVGSPDSSGGPFWCEQDDAARAEVGSYYEFKVASRSSNVTFNVGNGSIARTSIAAVTQENGRTVYTYRLYAQQTGTTNVFISADATSYRVFSFTAEKRTPQPVYGYINGSDVRLRSGPSTSSSILSVMQKNTQVVVLDTSNPQWAKIQLSTGVSGYVFAEYLTLGTPGGEGTTSLSLSASSGSVPAGKSLYVKATVKPAGNFVTWSSSNPSVAVVQSDNNYGYILGKSTGTAVITASSGSYQAKMTLTVTAAEPVHVTYASPNIVSANENATLYAITDVSRTGVRFLVDGHTYTASLKATDTVNGIQTKVWSASVSSLSAGTHGYTVQSTTGSGYQNGGNAEIHVSAQTSYTQTTQENRRASDKIIQFIAEKEGYYATPYRDTLTSDQIPTTGYGFVLYPGDTFYNNLSEREALAALVDDINSNYMPSVNRLRSSQNLWMSQSQADALVSFAYNVGTKYFNSTQNECTFRDVLLNAVVPPSDVSTSKPYNAAVTNATTLYSQQNGAGSQLASLRAGTALQVIGITDRPAYEKSHKDIWYQVKYNGTTGWVSSAYVHLDDHYGLKHDLNYTHASAMGTEFIQWCYASGTPIKGLYWRRLAEANIYNFNDYDAEKAKSNPYSYTAPSAFR